MLPGKRAVGRPLTFLAREEEEKVGSRLRRGSIFGDSPASNRWTRWFPVSSFTRGIPRMCWRGAGWAAWRVAAEGRLKYRSKLDLNSVLCASLRAKFFSVSRSPLFLLCNILFNCSVSYARQLLNNISSLRLVFNSYVWYLTTGLLSLDPSDKNS